MNVSSKPTPASRVRALRGRVPRWLAYAAVIAAASCAPTGPSASPASSSGAAFVLDLDSGGQTTQLLVSDPDGTLVEARQANGPETAAALNALAQSDIVSLRPVSDDVVVGWLVTPCDRQATLTIAATAIFVAIPPRPGCDAMGIGRVVALHFVDPARAALMKAQLMPAKILPEEEPRTPVAPLPTALGD